MSTEQNRFPLKAEDHIEYHGGCKLNGEYFDPTVVLSDEDYEALAACWHSAHGDRAIRVQCQYHGFVKGQVWVSSDEPHNATLILDEEKK